MQSTSEGIPQMCTTMMVESSLAPSEKRFSPQFNKPRLDLLVWILVTKLQPLFERKLSFQTNQTSRFRGLSPWRKEFKQVWRKMEKTAVSNQQYDTNLEKWIYLCPSYLLNRFLTSVHAIPTNSSFFRLVKRHHTTPFYTHPDLRPRQL